MSEKNAIRNLQKKTPINIRYKIKMQNFGCQSPHTLEIVSTTANLLEEFSEEFNAKC
jgi:hypothetical protein